MLLGLQEWVVDVCLHLCSCTNVNVYFGFFDVLNVMTGTSFMPTPPHKPIARGKRYLGRGSLKYF